MSRYENGHPSRGLAADYYTHSVGGASAPPSYGRAPSPGYTTHDGKPQARLTYEPQETSYAPRSHSRPRSLAPPTDSPQDRTRERKYDSDSDDGKARSPLEAAKRFVDNTFTNSTTGLGVGVLGALVGGLAAREAVDLTSNRDKQQKGHNDDAEHKRNQLIGTVVGAAVGALGANAVEKRIETRRARGEREQEKWERKWRRPEGEPEILEKIDVVARPRSRARSRDRDDWDAWDDRDRGRDGRSTSRRGVSRDVDLGARSWKSVEDWLYLEDGDDGRRHRSRDSYRH
ncbi:hypothetical protein RRF57_012233 [Xylaria bambusicola]|uniref:Uncharacterized protein n=1 Tax=Xylaria bambusicola TaxID=326684 RepID=A0AAN7V0D5_9PEZI